MRAACADTPVRAAFVVPFGFYERVSRVDEACPLPRRAFSLSLSLSLALALRVSGDFFTSPCARINRQPQRAETRFRYSATVWKTS